MCDKIFILKNYFHNLMKFINDYNLFRLINDKYRPTYRNETILPKININFLEKSINK